VRSLATPGTVRRRSGSTRGFPGYRAAVGRPTIDGMSIQPAMSQVPAGPVLLTAVGAQLVDNAVIFLIPPTAFVLGPLAGLLAIALTAGAARAITAGRTGPVVARTGLVVGLASAGVGLVVGGLGLVALLLAGITVLAGVAGAVAGRELTATRLP